VPGWDVRVLDERGRLVKPGDIGALVCKLPLPPGTLPTLWNADARYRESYLEDFPGYYKTGDAGFIDEDGYVFVMTRTDDVINVPGIGSRRGRWRRCSPRTRTSPNAP
jgi:propionyl-CoA synthetase